MEGSGKKKPSFWSRLFSGTETRRESRPKTIIKIKTVGDIPPIVETRKLLGEGKGRDAIMHAYNFAKEDYARYYNINLKKNETNRQFIIHSLENLGAKIPQTGIVDNHAISDGMNTFVPLKEDSLDQFNALKKLSSFYLDYYEKTRFGEVQDLDQDTVIERLEDFYNYLDIMRLYYAEVQPNDPEISRRKNVHAEVEPPAEEDKETE